MSRRRKAKSDEVRLEGPVSERPTMPTTRKENGDSVESSDGGAKKASGQRRSSRAPKKQPWSRRWVFGMGAIVGVITAWYFASDQVNLKLGPMFDNLDMTEVYSDLASVLPASVLKEAREVTKHRAESVNYDAFSVGRRLRKDENLTIQYPTIMIPGVISTGLESWSTEGCAAPYYRKRLWGSWSMLRAMLVDKPCWSRQISLDPVTGLDPPDAKLRAAQGFDAADFFITGYWIWNKIIENLSVIGGEPNNLFTASYDWRLSYHNMEARDGYFTKLKMHIENTKRVNGAKSVLVSHSMGGQVFFWFMKWVEAKGFGNGGPHWVNDHIAHWINISGSMLGTPKTVAALISGEMKDTAQLNAFSLYGLETFFSKKERASILRTLPGIASMLPKGRDKIWGNLQGAPDDNGDNEDFSFGHFIKFKTPKDISANTDSIVPDNMTMSESMDFLMQHTNHDFHRMLRTNFSDGVAETIEEVQANEKRPEKWINPLEVALPNAPDMKIYCMYGVGKPTERAYFCEQSDYEQPNLKEDMDQEKSKSKETANMTLRTPLEIPFARSSFIDNSVNVKSHTEKGVTMGEGDGTVSLLSAGYMCHRGWQMPRYNPARIPIINYEMEHEPDRLDMRGGPRTADHVDILGRAELNAMILKVVGGKGSEIQDKIVSNILKYVDKVDIPFS